MLDKNNLNNVHFIYTISKIFKISNNMIFKSLNLFKGLKFRKQIIFDKWDLKIINDSKSTSFSSTSGLLSTYTNIYWIVGGKFKKGDKFILEKKYYKNIKLILLASTKVILLINLKTKYILNI